MPGQEDAMRHSRAEKTDWPAILVDATQKPGVIAKAYNTFWRYSFGNQLSAYFQCLVRGIEPGPINTYKGWQQIGRQVKKGEKALWLTMPVTVKCKRLVPSLTGENDETKADPPQGTRTVFVERPNWFVLSQTAGKEYVPAVVPDWDEARALRTLSIDRIPFRHLDGNCQGSASGRTVALSPIAFMPHRTLFHEVAHVVLGHTEESNDMSDGDERTPRDIRELEAECVALICSESLGLSGAEFSRGYIQHWFTREAIPEKSVHRIFKAADSILKAGRPPDPDSSEP
jgi:antirestriction protein ArdC